MNNADQNQTADTATASQVSEKPQASSSNNKHSALLAEIAALTQSGENPFRLRALQLEYDADRVRQIDQVLKAQDQELMGRLRAQQRSCLEALDWIVPALERRDLAVTEVIELARLHQRHTDRLWDLLLKEKQLIEQKRRPAGRTRSR